MAEKEKTSEEKIIQLRADYVQGLSTRFLDMNQAYDLCDILSQWNFHILHHIFLQRKDLG